MKVMLIGYTHKQGVFNDKEYDNYQLYLVKEVDNEKSNGFVFVSETNTKIKASALAYSLGCKSSEIPVLLNNLMGKDEIEVFFNEYGRLDSVLVNR